MNIEILNQLKPPKVKRDQGKMKKNRGDEALGVIIHIYMEISQGNSLWSYLYHKQAKMSVFSFYKIGE
jgi:hypothetical protein